VGPNPSHTFASTGKFTVTVTATDSNGSTASASLGPYAIFVDPTLSTSGNATIPSTGLVGSVKASAPSVPALVTLPDVVAHAANGGGDLTVRKADATGNSVTVQAGSDGVGGQFINNGGTTPVLAAQNNYVLLRPDPGSRNWFIIATG
jgi:hypothetical protein